MALLQQYDPPAYLSDFDAIPGQREAWHAFVQDLMGFGIANVVPSNGDVGQAPLYDAVNLDPGPIVEQQIVWNAFPGDLLRRLDRPLAWEVAERPMSIWSRQTDDLRDEPHTVGIVCRAGTEYCEWHVDKDRDGKTLRRISFTTEPPEYWQALWGGPPLTNGGKARFAGCPDEVLRLYRKYVNPNVELDDLRVGAPFNSPLGMLETGCYNPYNIWNVSKGIMHLTSRPNQLSAEVFLTADATRRYIDAAGSPVVRPEAIAAGTNVANANRNSDLAILGSINALTRQGRRLTLANPVGIYIDHIDLAGWWVPGSRPPRDWVRVIRGGGRRICRLVVEAPDGISSLAGVTIGDVPLAYGGQIAECITVGLTAAASVVCDLETPFCPLTTRAYVEAKGGREICQPDRGQARTATMAPAFGQVSGFGSAGYPVESDRDWPGRSAS
jgi:hypothetical protein